MSTTNQPALSFSLYETVTDVCNTNPTVADPYDLAELVLAKIDPQDYRDALQQALHPYLTGYVTQHRATNHQPSPPSGRGGRTVGRSRLAGVGDFLASRQYSPDRGGWILLSEATEADLRSIAAQRDKVATTYNEKTRWFAAVADLLVTHHADTVGALPKTVQSALAAGTLP